MDVLIERCAGIDIGKADLKACVRTPGARGRRSSEVRTFATTTGGVLALRDWLTAAEVTVVGMGPDPVPHLPDPGAGAGGPAVGEAARGRRWSGFWSVVETRA